MSGICNFTNILKNVSRSIVYVEFLLLAESKVKAVKIFEKREQLNFGFMEI